ncbi:polyprenol phosphomannose-dependent alpha 1,6 mannosyltransferase MptB [Streptomyces termitum]|uniref:polyprenol phosphomannose-dependent alpha 1,6 mannosyltransferase MptB n=1 Tax=Streptomyces termitum TaxID=67368 RepID=UPI0033BF17B5
MWAVNASGCRWLGAGGALAVTAGGYAAGALPVLGGDPLWTPRATGPQTAGAVLAALGLTLLVLAWWRYGVLLARGAAGIAGGALGTLAAWAGPLLLAPPLHSADVYSYVAQGAMVLEGHDVYGAGPSVLGPGDLGADAAASVGGNWTDTPAPYGPAFLLLAEAAVRLTGGSVVPAVLLLRLLAVGSVALIVWAVRGFGRGDGALWLAALNPLLLVHVVGGVHNDGLTAGLMLAGVLLAVRGRWVWGSVLVGCAVMVKTPAAVALLFIGVLVARRAGGGARGIAKGLVLPGAVAGAVAAGASLLAGTGFGWLGTQSVAGAIHTPLSLTSDLGLALGTLLADDPGPVKAVVQRLGLLAAAALIAALAWRAYRGRTDSVLALGFSLLALVALSPMVQPWYPLWGTVAVAAVAWHSRAGQVLAVLSAALVYETQPSGHTPWYGFAAAGLVLALGAVWLRRERWPSARAPLPEKAPARNGARLEP